jgi:4-hydroxybenzoate polyprenyltransferase
MRLCYHNHVFDRLRIYSRFVKVEHTLFALPLLFSGAMLATGRLPSLRLSLLIIGAGFGARTAAFAFNRVIDRHIDHLNPRTAVRELPSGTMTLAEAWAVGLAGAALYVWAAGRIASLCLYLSPIPLAVFLIYPYLKRFTPLAHFGVGAADALAPLGGWLAAHPSFTHIGPALWLGGFTFFWVSGFDVIYATMDETFDRAQGLHSLPARYGKPMALKISGVLHLAAFGCLSALYVTLLRTPVALVTLIAIGGLLFLEHRLSDDVNLSFFKINAVLGFGILGFVAAGLGGLS